MSEVLYGIDSLLIAAMLFVSMAGAIELGYRAGRLRNPSASVASREHVNAIQGAVLGVLALLLGFTFSLSLQRFDSRSEAVVDEANAIGTAYLRIQLLPASLRDEARRRFGEYVDTRAAAGQRSQVDRAGLDDLLAMAARQQTALWELATKAAQLDPGARAPLLFAEAVNQLIDSFGRRDAALRRHVPEIVLLLLFGTFLMAGATVGFASGVAAHRPSLVAYLMVVLIVVLVFIILDLDRPGRGLIQVSQKSLLDLQATIHADRR